jgi:hypothetical protein
VDTDGGFEDVVELDAGKPGKTVLIAAEIVVVVFEVFVLTTKGQQSGLSFTHPMKPA